MNTSSVSTLFCLHTSRSLVSTHSSVLIILTYRKHQHRLCPLHTIQFNISCQISLTLHILY